MHIFPHFSEFLLIFHRRSILTKIAPLCVCVCEVFELHPRGERLGCGCVGSGSIQPVKVAFDSPARAEYDAHFSIFFAIFFHFRKVAAETQPDRAEWMLSAPIVAGGGVEPKRHPKWKIDTNRAVPVR